MATSIKINGTTLVPIKDAAATISYSRDYVARLAREGKIVASQVGRQWFIDQASLQTFSEAALEHEAMRKEELRQERRRELHAKEEFVALDKSVAEKIATHHRNAVAVTLSALGLGLTVGVSVYTVWLYVAPQSVPASAVAVVTAPLREVSDTAVLPAVTEPHQTMQLTTVMEQPVFTDEFETRALAGEGVFILPQSGQVTGAEGVAALFSDPVEVQYKDTNSGIVFYRKPDGSVVEYPFVTVPTKADVATTMIP